MSRLEDLRLGERLAGRVFGGELGVGEAPVDAERGVVPEEGTVGRRVPGRGAFVEDFGVFAEHGEAVSEARRDPEHAVVFGTTQEVMPEDLPDKILENTEAAGLVAINYQDAVKEAKKQIVLSAIHQANGSYIEAAKLLHIHPNNLHRLIRELNLKSRVPNTRMDH